MSKKKPENLPAHTWRKSTYSSGNGQCVEVAFKEGLTAVRDSKHPESVVWFGAVNFRLVARARMRLQK